MSKDALRVEVYGTLDELTSWVGVARAFVKDADLDDMLEFIQHRLYNCSSNLAAPAGVDFELPSVSEEDVAWLERAMDFMQIRTPELNSFVLPGGGEAAGFLHIARTVCRRAERKMVALLESEPVDEQILKFINRTSDFLFTAGRYANVLDGSGDITWDEKFRAPDF